MNPRERLFQIGEVAERVGLSLRTVRYWGEVDLVAPSARTTGGFRLYSEDDVERLLLVKSMKPLGLTLQEMKELLDLTETLPPDDESRRESAALLDGYLQRTDDAIGKLERYLGQARDLRRWIESALEQLDAGSPQPSATGPHG